MKNITLCSDISPELSSSLYRKTIKLKEKSSNTVFEAVVTDTCGENSCGLIVSFDKRIGSKLNNKDFIPAEFKPKTRVEMDLRKQHNGNDFDLVD